MNNETKQARRPKYLEGAVINFADSTQLLFDTIDSGLKKEDERYFIVISSMLNTAVAIRRLLYKSVNNENEAFMLMRPLLERLVNYHYLKASSDIERERFFSFPYYRIFHNRNQEYSVGGVSLSLKRTEAKPSDIKKIDEFRRAFELFSETDPTMQWSAKSFKQRVAVVVRSRRVNQGMLALVSMLNYRDTSEVIHGSMYGLMMLTGIWDEGAYEGGVVTADEASTRISEKLTLQLSLLSRLMLDTALVIHSGKLKNLEQQIAKISEQIDGTLEKLDEATD